MTTFFQKLLWSSKSHPALVKFLFFILCPLLLSVFFSFFFPFLFVDFLWLAELQSDADPEEKESPGKKRSFSFSITEILGYEKNETVDHVVIVGALYVFSFVLPYSILRLYEKYFSKTSSNQSKDDLSTDDPDPYAPD